MKIVSENLTFHILMTLWRSGAARSTQGLTPLLSIPSKNMIAAENLHNPALIRARYNMTRAQMDLLIEEVSDRVEQRASKTIENAKHRAKELRRISENVAVLMGLDIQKVTDAPSFFALCDSLRSLASVIEMFEPIFDEFVAEHGRWVEEETTDTLREFIAWVRVQNERIGPLCEDRAREYTDGLRAARDEHADLRADIATMGLIWPRESD